MKILLIKMSSLGDILHTFPALTEALHYYPDLQVDWVVEGAFLDVVKYHPAVRHAIPANIRAWRKRPLHTLASGTWKQFKQQIKAERYDCIIDAQGLLKSAAVTRMGQGPKWGFDRTSAREPLSAKVLDRPVTIPWQQHAIERYRSLFAAALNYSRREGPLDYGLTAHRTSTSSPPKILLCHGTTWANKHWPETYWRELAERLTARGWQVDFPHGNDEEQARAERLASGLPLATVLPRMTLTNVFTYLLDTVSASVAGDTGLAHLAAAAGVPGVMIFGPTDPYYSGVPSPQVVNLGADYHCAPCMSRECQYERKGEAVWPPCMEKVQPEQIELVLMRQIQLESEG
ncbi:MAG TPA: lipopolysaccharide heptosyltransferase I [Alcanivoracaceae bacterium]|nr:lipopolysaccharide heptosyltransferase I [Alcanivoracaceae bacterium]